jgi:outer membrane protein TolC
MKRFSVAGIVACLILAAINIHASAAEVASADVAAQIKTLQKERVETLKSLVELYVQYYREGKIDITPVIGAQTELVNAQLDAAEDREERIALLTERLNAVTSFLKLAEQRWMAGMSSQADVYRAKSLLLDTKIKLLREQGARKARPK